MRILYLVPEGKKRIIILTAIGFAFALVLIGASTLNPKKTVGTLERVLLKTPSGESVETVAKIDTGADSSSIDEEYALSLGLKHSSVDRIITNARGRERRDTIELNFTLGGQNISTLATIADRSRLSTKMLIGKKDLSSFVVNPDKEFLTAPFNPSKRLLYNSAINFLNKILNQSVTQLILIIPILSAAIVILRIFTGLRTYGIFASVIIAITFIDAGILTGLATYTALLIVGLAAKTFFLSRLNLPHISEMSLIMFTIVLGLAIIPSIFFKTKLFLSDIFFPLIITSYLIERFTKSVEEHRMKEALPLLGQTIAVSIIAAVLGSYLINLSTNILWVIFLFSILVVIGASNYVGPRLSELMRFKF